MRTIGICLCTNFLAMAAMAADPVPVAGWVSHPVKPGERVLVSGGGWGAVAVKTVKSDRHGADVRRDSRSDEYAPPQRAESAFVRPPWTIGFTPFGAKPGDRRFVPVDAKDLRPEDTMMFMNDSIKVRTK